MMTRRQPAGRSALPGTSDGRFRHILVPTDLTARTESALQLAGQLVSRAGARVTLLHVIESIEGLALNEVKPFYERLEQRARKAMAASARRARGEDPPTPALAVVRGRRAEEIVKYAAANAVDLIVLASHRVNPSIVERDWGTISYKVGILAQCPVLLVK